MADDFDKTARDLNDFAAHCYAGGGFNDRVAADKRTAAALRAAAEKAAGASAFDAAGVLSYSILTLRCGLTMEQADRVITVVRSAIYDLERSPPRAEAPSDGAQAAPEEER